MNPEHQEQIIEKIEVIEYLLYEFRSLVESNIEYFKDYLNSVSMIEQLSERISAGLYEEELEILDLYTMIEEANQLIGSLFIELRNKGDF
jgi:signal transduction protein with GAF and PtsI domain